MKTIRIILLILIIIGIGLLCTQKLWVPKLVDKILQLQGFPVVSETSPTPKPDTYEWCIANGGADLTATPNSLKKCVLDQRIYSDNCIKTDKYIVISKNLTDSVGSDILVKYKTSPSQVISCDYSKVSGDFEIKNDNAEYLLALENTFLILDSGTGPYPRGLIIYNLGLRKEVFTDQYFGIESMTNGQIEYWSPTTIKPTTANCPKIDEWKSQIGGVSIESRVILDLSTLTKKDSGVYRCDPLQ